MASNRRWRGQFRYRGSRRESAVAQLFSLGVIAMSPLICAPLFRRCSIRASRADSLIHRFGSSAALDVLLPSLGFQDSSRDSGIYRSMDTTRLSFSDPLTRSRAGLVFRFLVFVYVSYCYRMTPNQSPEPLWGLSIGMMGLSKSLLDKMFITRSATEWSGVVREAVRIN